MRRILHIASACGALLMLSLFVVTPLASAAPATARLPVTGYSLQGSPTVSAALINMVLADAHSPAAGKGQALYDAGVRAGIDPVYALAFFMHESSFGTAGVAQLTLSLGNLRCIPTAACLDGFAAFPSWEAGFDAWYQLIDKLYISTWGLSTVEQIIPRYAPAADHNNEGMYISSVEVAVDNWRAQQVRLLGAMPASTTSVVPNTTQAPVTTSVTYPSDGYSVLGKPTVTVAFINQTLLQYHSPAVGTGQLIYASAVQYGIDPAYALAFFLHDSIFGTVGLARVTHAMGTLHASASADCRCHVQNGYRWYANWEDGIRDWYAYIHTYYIERLQATTIGQLVPAYSQVHDTAAIEAFIKVIEHRVDLWRAQPLQAPQP